MEVPQNRNVIGRHFGNGGVNPVGVNQTQRLEAVNGLIRRQIVHQVGISEQVAGCAVQKEERGLVRGSFFEADERFILGLAAHIQNLSHRGNRGVLEELGNRERRAGRQHALHQLNGQQGMTAQIKKVVMNANLFHSQNNGPDFRQDFFSRRVGRNIIAVLAGGGFHRRRQRFAIHFSAGRNRKLVQLHKGGWNHVFRQVIAKKRAQFFHRWRTARLQNIIGRKLLLVRKIGARHDNGLRDIRVLIEHRGNLIGLNSESANLDLIVHPAEEGNASVRLAGNQIPRPVKPALTPRVGNEFFGGELRTVQITARHPFAADQQFAGHADRNALSAGIGHIKRGVGNRKADRHVAAHRAAQLMNRGDHRAFGRAVGVEKAASAIGFLHPDPAELRRYFFAANNDRAQRFGNLLQITNPFVPVGGRKIHHGDFTVFHKVLELGNGAGQLVGAQHDGCAAGPRRKEFFDGAVKVHREKLKHTVFGANPVGFNRCAAVVDHVVMLHHHAFRFSCGTGGVENIGQVECAGVCRGRRTVL